MDIQTVRRCAWCKAEYTPKDEAQVFCSSRHSKNARARRRELEAAGKQHCPTPDKRQYGGVNDASLAIASIGRSDLEAYPCICGSWHIGSIPGWMASKDFLSP